jgi:hypothetical protein
MKKKAKATAGQQTDAQIATLAQQAMKPMDLPDPENASITDKIRMNDEAARKRKGRMSTLAGGAYGKSATVKTIASGGM